MAALRALYPRVSRVYPARSLWHLRSTSCLLTGGLSLGLAACALVDAAYKFFAPTSPRSLRLLSGLAGLVLLIGWGIWVYIYGNMAAVGTGSYRIGTFLLGAGSVLNLFVVAISFLDVQRKVK